MKYGFLIFGSWKSALFRGFFFWKYAPMMTITTHFLLFIVDYFFVFRGALPMCFFSSAGACQKAVIIVQLNPVIRWLACGEDCLQTAAWRDQGESDTDKQDSNRTPWNLPLWQLSLLIKHCSVEKVEVQHSPNLTKKERTLIAAFICVTFCQNYISLLTSQKSTVCIIG